MKKIFYIVLINLISLNYSFAESTFLDCEFKNGKTLRNLTEVVMVFSKGDKINETIEIDLTKKKIISGPYYSDTIDEIVDSVFSKFEKNKIIWGYESSSLVYIKRTVILNKINGELLVESLKVFYKNSEKTIIDNQFDYKLRYKCKKINKLL